jgi:hypothetical protein
VKRKVEPWSSTGRLLVGSPGDVEVDEASQADDLLSLREKGAELGRSAEADASCDLPLGLPHAEQVTCPSRADLVVKHVRGTSEGRAELARKVELGHVEVESDLVDSNPDPLLGGHPKALAGRLEPVAQALGDVVDWGELFRRRDGVHLALAG